MSNEEKILELLQQMNGRLDRIENDIASIKDNIEEIKEEAEITRSGVNTLIEWSENAGYIIKYPLNNKIG